MPVATEVPEGLLASLKREARNRGLSLEELVLEKLSDGLSDEEKVGAYLEAAEALLSGAREALAKGELRQASEKIWGATALAIKAHALAREGRRLTSHSELWEHKELVVAELGPWARDAWAHAASMHVNFHEGWATEADVREALERVGKLVRAIGELFVRH